MILRMDRKILPVQKRQKYVHVFQNNSYCFYISDLTSKRNGNEDMPNSTIVKILKILAVMSIIHWRLLSEDVPILGSLRALTHYNNFH